MSHFKNVTVLIPDQKFDSQGEAFAPDVVIELPAGPVWVVERFDSPVSLRNVVGEATLSRAEDGRVLADIWTLDHRLLRADLPHLTPAISGTVVERSADFPAVLTKVVLTGLGLLVNRNADDRIRPLREQVLTGNAIEVKPEPEPVCWAGPLPPDEEKGWTEPFLRSWRARNTRFLLPRLLPDSCPYCDDPDNQ